MCDDMLPEAMHFATAKQIDNIEPRRITTKPKKKNKQERKPDGLRVIHRNGRSQYSVNARLRSIRSLADLESDE